MRGKCLTDGQLPAPLAHILEACLLGEIFHGCVCLLVSICDLIDDMLLCMSCVVLVCVVL